MGRKVLLFVVVGLLISGLLGSALADIPPRRDFGGEPGPRPWEWGDPDWPSYSKDAGGADRPAGEEGDTTIRLDGRDVFSVRFDPSGRVQDRHRVPSRLYVVRILGHTIVIRR
jgi:hypothetical protein